MGLGVWLHLTEDHAQCTQSWRMPIRIPTIFTTSAVMARTIHAASHTPMPIATSQCATLIRTRRICIMATGTEPSLNQHSVAAAHCR